MNDIHLSNIDIKKIFTTMLVFSMFCYIAGFGTAKMFEPDLIPQIQSLESKLTHLQNHKREVPESTTSKPEIFSFSNVQEEGFPFERDDNVESYLAKPFAIQVGVFQFHQNASSLQSNLSKMGIHSQIMAVINEERPSYRVLLEQFENKRAALAELRKLQIRYNMALSLARLDDKTRLNKIAAY